MANPILVVIIFWSIIGGHSLSNRQPIHIPVTAYSSPDSSGSTCPSQDTINDERRKARNALIDYNRALDRPCSCEGPGWTRVAYLNMSDTNQQCPSNWRLTTSPVRGCGRSGGYQTCNSVIFPVNGRSYSSVCGRIIAYQKGRSLGLYTSISQYYGFTIDQSYISGVSVTHGPAGNRTHIWSFVGADSELPGTDPLDICACTNTNVTWPYEVPTIIRNDYFCDTGNAGAINPNRYYTDDPLWDGEGCGPTSTCCSFNSPPWFCKSLPQPTSDDLEIRLCGYNGKQYEDKVVSQLEISIQ